MAMTPITRTIPAKKMMLASTAGHMKAPFSLLDLPFACWTGFDAMQAAPILEFLHV
jgi:hypothetical protein